jgi:hypothetical protein
MEGGRGGRDFGRRLVFLLIVSSKWHYAYERNCLLRIILLFIALKTKHAVGKYATDRFVT